jgi:multidrug efflux pump
MNVTDIFVRRPVLATMVSVLIFLAGLRAFQELPVRQFPRVDSTVISITTVYPGATSELMRSFITTPIEQAVSTADGLDYLTSSSFSSRSIVTAHIKLNFDPGRALTEVLAKVQQVKYLIPPGALDPVITKTTGQVTPALFMGFSSESMSSVAISDYLSRVVQPLLASLPGITSSEIIGGQVFAMRLWLDPRRMAARGISADDVIAAVRGNNFQAAPGQAKGRYTVTSLEAATDASDVQQFRDLIVKARPGDLVRVRDIGEVELGPQSTDTDVTMNGNRAVFIAVNAVPDGNPMETVRAIRARLPDLRHEMPPGLEVRVTYDSTLFIQASIREVVRTFWEAGLIVLAVIFLTLGNFRSALVPLVAIPLSLVGGFALMLMFGFTLNLLTLLAMVMAVGLVVDDAIVVLENVHRHVESGLSPSRAALLGGREISGPVVAMTLTLAVAYLPIGLLDGLTGTLFREFAFTLAGTVIVSGVVALTLSPMMCVRVLRSSGRASWLERSVNGGFGRLAGWYGRFLRASLANRAATMLFACGMAGLLVFELANSGTELAPQEDQGIIFAALKAPQYANLDYTREHAAAVDTVFRSFPETENDFVVSGTIESTNLGLAGMILKPWDERDRTAQDLTGPLMGRLFGEVSGVRAFAFNPPPLPGSIDGLPFQMVISSPGGYEEIHAVMERIKQRAYMSGKFMVVDSDLNFEQPGMRLKVNHAMANEMGVPMQAIANTLALMVGENFISRFGQAGRSYYVVPQAKRSDRGSADMLDHFYVTAANGAMVPLATLASFEQTPMPNAMNRYNQLNSATLSAIPGIGVTMGEAVATMNAIAREVLPNTFRYDYLAQSRQFLTEGKKLNVTIGFALLAIYLILAAQFGGFRDPLVIMVTVPLAACGALIPIFLGVVTLNLYTQVGLVTLIGLIAKHGILMVSFAGDLRRRDGLDRADAIHMAAVARLRPVLMTTVAMVLGLFPLIWAHGAGASSRFAIGMVIACGLVVGTICTLFVLPAVYTLLAAPGRSLGMADRPRVGQPDQAGLADARTTQPGEAMGAV